MDREVQCDDAENGTPCGRVGSDWHCLYDSCVENSCGDGVRSGAEACDDGNERNGDGCDERCKMETCGDGHVDSGEECDDGNDVDDDVCRNSCVWKEAPVLGIIEVIFKDEVTLCPVVTGISALPLETTLGHDLTLIGHTSSSRGAAYEWVGDGGSFATRTAEATAFTCASGGKHVLAFTVAKPGCEMSAMEVTVTCTDLSDAGTGAAGAGGDGGS